MVYTIKEAFSKKNRFHCTLSYSFDDFAHVVQRLYKRSQIAAVRDDFGVGLKSRNHAISPLFASLYAPRWQSTQLTDVAAAAGSTMRPMRRKELFARAGRAA